MKKKMMALLVLVLLLVNMLPSGQVLADTVKESKLPVFDTGLDPVWSIENVEVDDKIAVGQEFKVTVTVRNIGSGVGFFPVIAFTEDDYKPLSHFAIVGSTDGVYQSGIEQVASGETKAFTVKMRVLKDTKELPENTSYKINATFKSNNWDLGNGATRREPSFAASTSFYVNPSYTLTEPTFVVKSINFAEPVDAQTTRVTATLTIDNISDTKARNVTVALDGNPISAENTNKNIKVLDISNTKRVGDIAGKRSLTVTYELEADGDRKNNEMKLTVKYDGQKEAQTETLNLPFPFKETGSATGKVPKVIINKYVLQPSKILAGNTVTLTLYIENTHGAAVNNVSMKLTVPTSEGNSTTGTVVSGGTVFSPVNSSNTFYLERIEGKSVVMKEINLYVDPNAQAKTYVVPVNFKYEDQDGKEHEGSDNINIPVTQESMVEIINSQMPAFGNVGAPVNYSVEFVNTGKVALTNFKATIEGDIPGTENNVYYVGKLDAAASDTFSGAFMPENEGVLNGNVVFTYRDADNKEVRLEQPFSVEVGPAVEMFAGTALPPEEPKQGFMSKLKENIVTVALVGVIVVLSGVLFRIKRKAKADEELFNG